MTFLVTGVLSQFCAYGRIIAEGYYCSIKVHVYVYVYVSVSMVLNKFVYLQSLNLISKLIKR